MVKGCEMLVDVGLPSMSDCLGSGLEVYLIIGLFSYRVCDDSAVSQFWCYPIAWDCLAWLPASCFELFIMQDGRDERSRPARLASLRKTRPWSFAGAKKFTTFSWSRSQRMRLTAYGRHGHEASLDEEAAQLKQQLHICLRRQQLNMLVVLPWLRQTVWEGRLDGCWDPE